jgi:hypothetical protein
MAISPKECIDHFTAIDIETLAALEKRVDAHLLKHYTGTAVSMSVSDGGINQRVIAQFQKNYEAVGWKYINFTRINNQRDGDYLELKMAEYPGNNYMER